MKLTIERYNDNKLVFKKTMPKVEDVEVNFIKDLAVVKFNNSFNLTIGEKKTNFNLHEEDILELIEDVDILKYAKVEIFDFENYMNIKIVHSY